MVPVPVPSTYPGYPVNESENLNYSSILLKVLELLKIGQRYSFNLFLSSIFFLLTNCNFVESVVSHFDFKLRVRVPKKLTVPLD